MTMKRYGKVVNIVPSKWFLLVLVGMWITYYVTYAIWSEQAFSKFVGALNDNLLIQSLYVLFLVSAFLNLIRVSEFRFKKDRYLFLLWIALPLGVIVFLTGFFLSTSLRHHENLIAGEGAELRPYWRKTAFLVSAIRPSLKDEILSMDPSSVIFQYEPKVLLESETGSVEVGVFPPKKVDDTYVHILRFGMAPGVKLIDGERILREGHVIQRILPPGIQDEFDLPPYPYTFSIRMIPDRFVTKGRTTAKIYNVKTPTYEVIVRKGQRVVFEGDSRNDVEFDGLKLSFEDPAYWVFLEMADDPGVMVILGGLAMIAVGVPLMLVHLLVSFRGILRR